MDKGFAFEAGDHTTMTVTIKDPPDAAPDAGATGPGLKVSATELDVTVGGRASYTVGLSALPVDVVTVAPSVQIRKKANPSPTRSPLIWFLNRDGSKPVRSSNESAGICACAKPSNAGWVRLNPLGSTAVMRIPLSSISKVACPTALSRA